MIPGDPVAVLRQDIEQFTAQMLEGYEREAVSERKIIRDAVLGTHSYAPWEIHLIDTPLVQRLRDIHQTALAYFTYPSAHHTRFEHTLGVRTVASRLLRGIRARERSGDIPCPDFTLSDGQVDNAICACLLHDIGHAFFSHVSEQLYGRDPALQALKKDLRIAAKGHELVSYLLVCSGPLRKLIERIGDLYSVHLDPDQIAALIVGHAPKKERFLANIVNSVIDCDKLDYIPRDCYATGLNLGTDLDRVYYTTCLLNNHGEIILAIDMGGAYTVEQILFNKMLLFSAIYYHHKVRAAECMIYALCEVWGGESKKGNVFPLESPVDFLRASENTVLDPNGKPKPLADFIRRVINRRLYQRAGVICQSTVVPSQEYFDFLAQTKNPEMGNAFRTDLLSALRARDSRFSSWTLQDVWLDMPPSPTFDETSNSRVRIPDGLGAYTSKPLSDLFPTANWSDAYTQHKLKGHVFCSPSPPDMRSIVCQEARRILEGEGVDITVLPGFELEAKIR